MTSIQVAVPGAPFNFAQHLLETNGQRASKTAFIDDSRVLT